MNDRFPTDHDGCEITECECGLLTLRIGRLRIELSREELVRLRHELAAAAARFNLAMPPAMTRQPVH